jgi:glycosyltransferase involved in cell wall biosynthesis
MVTRDRVEMAISRIASFLNQDYPQKALLVVSESGPTAQRLLSQYVDSLRAPNVTLVHVQPERYSLGALRNISLAEAQGEIVCQWDDDDLYHPRRISVQAGHMLKQQSAACFLSDQLQFVSRTASLYWCDWTAPRSVPRWPSSIPNTVLCWRDAAGRYPETGAISRRSEDLVFRKDLFRRWPVTVLADHGPLYIYVSHGANAWNEEHHLRIARVTGLDAVELRRRRPALEGVLREHTLPSAVIVRGYDDEVAFVLERGDGCPSVAPC